MLGLEHTQMLVPLFLRGQLFQWMISQACRTQKTNKQKQGDHDNAREIESLRLSRHIGPTTT